MTIVGRGIIDPAVPFGALDQRGPFGEMTIGGGDYQTGRRSPAVLMVDGVDAGVHAPAFDVTGRTYVWTAPVDVGAVHPWTAGAFRTGVEDLTRDLVAADAAYSIESPLSKIAIALGLADASSTRLLLIGSLGVAILLAFAVFLAQVVRDYVAAEVARLEAVGARRRDRVSFLVLEAAVPAVIGGIIGWIVGALVVVVLAGWALGERGGDPGRRDTGPGTGIAAGLVILVAVVTTVLATTPGRAWGGGVRTVVAIVLTAIVVLAWQLASSGAPRCRGPGAVGGEQPDRRPVAAGRRVRGSTALGHGVATATARREPPIASDTAGAAALAAVPLARPGAARGDRGPPGVQHRRDRVRHVLVGDPTGRDRRRHAAYRSGLDLRVTELARGCRSRHRSYRSTATRPSVPTSRPSRSFVRAAPPSPGAAWISSASTPRSCRRSRLAGGLLGDSGDRAGGPASGRPPAGGWAVGGHRLPEGAPELDLRFRYTGESLRLDAIVWTKDGDSTRIPLGTIRDGMTRLGRAAEERRRRLVDDARLLQRPDRRRDRPPARRLSLERAVRGSTPCR